MPKRKRQSWRWAEPDWGDDGYKDARSELVGYLDEIRVESTRWRADLAAVGAAAKVSIGALTAAIGSASPPESEEIAGNIAGLVGMHPILRERFEGDAAELKGTFKQLDAAWPRDVSAPGAALDGATTAQRLAEAVALHCAKITLPVWANRELAEMATGQVLDVNAEFAEDVPDPKAREKLLDDLATRSRSVSAYIVPDAGKLYRTPSGALMEFGFTIAPFVALALCAAVATVVGNLHAWWSSGLTNSFPEQWNDSSTLLGGYVAAALGAVAHLYVDWYKAKRLVGDQQIVVPRRIRQRIEVYASELCVSAVVVLAVSLAWIWIANRTDAETMILVGYSADSLLSAFVARFSSFATSGSSALVAEAR